MIKTYRKTATIKAEQFDGSNEMVDKYRIKYDEACMVHFRIETPEGWIGIKACDWIATGVNGEHWPIADDVFRKTYDELPVIPKYVDEYIRLMRSLGKSVGDAIKYWLREDEIDNYMEYNSEKFVRAWLDGYRVEAEHDTRTD
ncbi:DUF1642 domain-containing protein [Levilactobacillus brevis]|uniref:DUF1642 domain-containing protein n=1 Tax=Levilactobacillus brevis TaxID=1580 RepID=UPI0021A39C7F|nr:DUF1642 domain-containing protein [Levilactobacillus brevis]MCT3599065.1 DUF1642 domain-containing protein [Levilactobacillus brevis]